MYIDKPKISNNVWVVVDTRTRTDYLLEHNSKTPNSVHSKSPLMRAFFGEQQFNCTTRIALFDYKETPTPNERRQAAENIVNLIRRERPAYVCVFPTPSSTIDPKAGSATKGTLAWQALKPPDSIDEMRGTFWSFNKHTKIVPMYACVPVIDETQKLMNQQWCGWAAHNKQLIAPKIKLINPEAKVLTLLSDAFKEKIIAVDIETIPSENVITAIGLGFGTTAISIPWDAWQPAVPGAPRESGLDDYGKLGKQIRELLVKLLKDKNIIKVGQNFMFDIKGLKAAGLTVEGQVEDTLALHSIFYPTLPHGLQKAAATMFPVAPWKSEFKLNGVPRQDERFWRWEPQALRSYNALDAYFTLHLWNTMREQVI